MHLDDFWKAKETAGAVSLALHECKLGGGRRAPPGVNVGCGVLENSELLLGNRLITDIGIGWKRQRSIPAIKYGEMRRMYPAIWTESKKEPLEDNLERSGQPNIGCRIGGHLGGPLNRCTPRHVRSALGHRVLSCRPFDTRKIIVRTTSRGSEFMGY